MRKFELSLASDYIPEWTVVDAIRELFQNALDEEAIDPENAMTVQRKNDKLYIGNHKSSLTTKSLLLGGSTKKDDKHTIGKFGEGYKLATLVLLRLGHKVVIHNREAGEIWRPRFVDSKRYDAKVLTFFVESNQDHGDCPLGSLIFVVDNITDDVWTKIVDSNLHLQPPGNVNDTPKGQILLDEDQHGRIYINGLYVCFNKDIKYGYNIKPEYLAIDRDRRLVGDFDLQWLTSDMWASRNEDAIELLKSGAPDVRYARHKFDYTQKNRVYKDFIEEHGEKAVPVSTQSELKAVPAGYTPVLVNDEYKSVIVGASDYEEPTIAEEATALEKLRTWYDEVCFNLPISTRLMGEFELIFSDLEELL